MDGAFAPIGGQALITGAGVRYEVRAAFVRVGSTSRVFRGRLGSGLLLCCGRGGRSLFGWCRINFSRVASDRRLLRGLCHRLFAGGFAASADVF
jgi:hypothetical protein